MKDYSGAGLLNTALNKLPLPELHLPGYNFCGPYTKLEKRLARGDKGINELDEACKEHDIAYSKSKDVKHRHEADKILATKALARFRSKDASMKEKLAALGITGAMKAKVKLGMGYGGGGGGSNKSNCLRIIKKCTKVMDKLKKTTNSSLKTINQCLNDMEVYKIDLNKETKRKVPKKSRRRKRQRQPARKAIIKRKLNFDVEEEEEPIPPAQVQPLEVTTTPVSRKRKFTVPPPTITTDTPIKKTKPISRKRKLNFSNDDGPIDVKKIIIEKTPIIRKRKLTNNNPQTSDVPFKRVKLVSRKRKLNVDDDNDDSSKTPTGKKLKFEDHDNEEDILRTPL